MNREMPPPDTTKGNELIAVDGVWMDYGGAPIIANLDLAVRSGEIIALTGPNGCGKSTLLRGLAGLQPMESQGLRLAGVGTNPHSKAHRRETCAIMDSASWLPDLTVAEHLSLMFENGRSGGRTGRDNRGHHRDKATAESTVGVMAFAEGEDSLTATSESTSGFTATAGGTAEGKCARGGEVAAQSSVLAWTPEEAINALGLWGLEDRLPHQLSSGQRQRAALSLALVRPWSVLFLDEPEQRLDTSYQQILAELLRDLVAVGERCVIMATHSRQLLEECGAREICIEDQQVSQ